MKSNYRRGGINVKMSGRRREREREREEIIQ